jgi:hypothetical protein
MPGKKRIKSKSKKSMSDWDRMLAGVDESRLNARGRAALAQLRSGPIQVSANAVPRLSDIARAVASIVRPTQASRAGGVSPLAKISNTIGNVVSADERLRPPPPARKKKLSMPPKTSSSKKATPPRPARRRPARRLARVR